jgi:hypothetical protein
MKRFRVGLTVAALIVVTATAFTIHERPTRVSRLEAAAILEAPGLQRVFVPRAAEFYIYTTYGYYAAPHEQMMDVSETLMRRRLNGDTIMYTVE